MKADQPPKVRVVGTSPLIEQMLVECGFVRILIDQGRHMSEQKEGGGIPVKVLYF